MDFHEVRFPAVLSFGSLGGPERRTEIVSLSNGFEERNTPWAYSRRRFDAGVGLRSLDDLDAVIAFFEARSGQVFGFRWKDWTDFKSCVPSGTPAALDQALGTGDGVQTAFSLVKIYASGAENYVRPVVKPVAGTVLVSLDGAAQVEAVDYTLDTVLGEVTFVVAPGVAVNVTAGFEFDVPVRFDTARIETSVASFSAGEIPSVPIVEVRV